MGILGRIGEAKRNFKDFKEARRSKTNNDKAVKLQQLKEERIKLEGQANLEKLRDQETARIRTAKQNTGLTKKAIGFAKGINNARTKLGKSNMGKGSTGLQFGGGSSNSSFSYGGERSLDIGGGSSNGGAFSMGSRQQIEKPKPKPRVNITIR